MPQPAMILFDYGHTLVYEEAFSGVAGAAALLQAATANPKGTSADGLAALLAQLFQRFREGSMPHDIEVHHHAYQRAAFQALGLEFALDDTELETLYWDTAAPGRPMEDAADMLAALGQMGIRSGVISNISFSGAALRHRLNTLLPGNRFEFVLASSEYAFRKPDPLLFQVALNKAGLLPQQLWYCGDHARCDVGGAAAVGIWPVWFRSPLPCYYRLAAGDQKPAVPHAEIAHWRELLPLLQNA